MTPLGQAAGPVGGSGPLGRGSQESLMPLYQGETLWPEMSRWLYQQGYFLVGLEPGHSDSGTGQLMQVDGIFHRLGR